MGRPMLDDVELQQVQAIETEGDQVLAQHGIPALEGDFLQGTGRRATQITLAGVLTGPEARDGVQTLREKFRAAQPVSFVADIATATQVDQVLIEELGLRDIAGRSERFEYALMLREFIPPPRPQTIPPPPPPPPPPQVDTGTLIVKVIVEGEPNFDFSTVTVTVNGTRQDGTTLTPRTLTNRTSNDEWTEENFPLGQYTASAVVTAPEPMSGSAPATVRAGQTTRVTITLRPGTPVAKAFIVHFWFDKAFVEPCMRHVLAQVTQYAQAHPSEKLVIVGHTDKVGSDTYNQSLSERRGRSAYACLTFGRDRAGALGEWNTLRVTRPVGEQPSVKDSWGTREYQYMLQDLGYYPGNVDGDHGPMTDAAVRSFQHDQGLAEDGIVGDDTWDPLIEAYLSQDNLAVPDSQFLANCPGEILKWLGCGEQDPVRNTEDAWRPNRRTELLFVNASALPCEVPQPDTFNLPTPGVVAGGWCVGPGNPNQRCCFLARQPGTPGRWLVQPAEPGTIVVRGSIRFEDGTPAANMKYVLIAPDGEFMDGERPSGTDRGRPIFGRTAADGTFAYPDKPKGIGIYTFELQEPYVARLDGEPLENAKGSVACKRLDGSSDFDVVIVSQAVIAVRPSITLANTIAVVKKPHTNPTRQMITLRVDNAFTGSGAFTRSNTNVRFFTAAVGGTEITFNGTDNLFADAQLLAGVQLFAEGGQASAAMDDVELALALTVNGQSGLTDRATMTAVEITLDVALSRTAPGVDPPVMPENDKINTGRHVQVSDSGFSHERAMLIVRPPNPAAFVGTLVLASLNAQVQAFNAEMPASGQAPIPNPRPIPTGGIPASGLSFFAEGRTASAAVRDTGFQLGIQGLETDGDRVPMTTVQIGVADTDAAAAPAVTFVRFGLWDKAYNAAGDVRNDVAEANNFVGADRRKFHIRVNDTSATGSVQVNWKTLKSDNTNDDAPVSQVLTLTETAPGTKIFISKGVMLVTDDTDRDFPTHSGFSAPHADAGLRNAGQSNHRTRRARIDGFTRVEYSPAAGIQLPVTLPVFNREVPFSTGSTDNIAAGTRTVTPAAMSATEQGIKWTIRVGSRLTIDTGVNQEVVIVTAVTGTTFTAVFVKGHNGSAGPFPIAGVTDERRHVNASVIRYVNPGDAQYFPASEAYINSQFERANQRWNQIGVRIDRAATIDRQVPAAAIVNHKFPFDPNPNNPREVALLSDLIPITPDNTVAVVFIDMTGSNAFAEIDPVNPIALPNGTVLTMGDRFFIFIQTNLNLNNETLAHEFHHVLFNRFDAVTDRQFYTLNTSAPTALVQGTGIILPDVRIYRRIQNLHAPDPNNDPNNNNIVNWVRRERTTRYPAASGLGVATATTGNTLLQDL